MLRLFALFAIIIHLFSSPILAEEASAVNQEITGEVATEEEIFESDCCEYNVYYGKCVKDTSQPGGLRCKLNDLTLDRYSCTDFYPHKTSMKTCDEKNRNPPPVGNCKESGKTVGSDCRTATATTYMKDARCDGAEGGNRDPTFKCIAKKKTEEQTTSQY